MNSIETTGLFENAAATIAEHNAKKLTESKKSESKKSDSKKMEEATKGFESLMLKQVINSLWETVDPGNLFGGEKYESEMYQGIVHDALAESLANGRGIGIKEFIAKNMRESKLLPEDEHGLRAATNESQKIIVSSE